MADTIKLDSSHRSTTRAVVKDSVLTCTTTSAADVTVKGIVSNNEEHELHLAESMIVPKLSTLIVRLFRASGTDEPFSAELDLSPVADDEPSRPKTASRGSAKRSDG
jgi:hypothetical protein